MSSIPSVRLDNDPPAPPDRRRRRRLAGGIAAAIVALTLAACGTSQHDPVDQLAGSAAAAADVPHALDDLASSLGNPQPPAQDELSKKYDEWLARKAGSGGTVNSESSGSTKPDKPLAVGDCTDHLPTGAEDTAALIPSVDCAGEHLTEVYLSVPLDQLGPEFPGYADIIEAATEGCGAGFVEYIGIPWADSQNTFQFVTPTKASWQDGDTNALCFAYPGSFTAFTGALKGSNQ